MRMKMFCLQMLCNAVIAGGLLFDRRQRHYVVALRCRPDGPL
jgi:hypothetical protein